MILVPKVLSLVDFITLGTFIETSNLFTNKFNLQMSHFVYQWGCTSNYRPLSYPLISMNFFPTGLVDFTVMAEKRKISFDLPGERKVTFCQILSS